MNWIEELGKQGRAYKGRVGGEGKKYGVGVDSTCKTPGMKIRSGGAGRGLARGMGQGPRNIPRYAK